MNNNFDFLPNIIHGNNFNIFLELKADFYPFATLSYIFPMVPFPLPYNHKFDASEDIGSNAL